jgi:hypothetical protein
MEQDLSKLELATGQSAEELEKQQEESKKKSHDSLNVSQKNIKEIFKKRQKAK